MLLVGSGIQKDLNLSPMMMMMSLSRHASLATRSVSTASEEPSRPRGGRRASSPTIAMKLLEPREPLHINASLECRESDHDYTTFHLLGGFNMLSDLVTALIPRLTHAMPDMFSNSGQVKRREMQFLGWLFSGPMESTTKTHSLLATDSRLFDAYRVCLCDALREVGVSREVEEEVLIKIDLWKKTCGERNND
jgi:hypothetical protein